MSDYTKITDFSAKTSGNDVLGAEWDAEFVAIQVALLSKQTMKKGFNAATVGDPGTIAKALYGIGYSSSNIPSLLTYGDRPILFATAPSGANTIDQTANMANGQCLPIMVAEGSSPTISAEASVGIYVPGYSDTRVALLLKGDGGNGVANFVDSGFYNLGVSYTATMTLAGGDGVQKFGDSCLKFVGGLSQTIRVPQTVGGPLDFSANGTTSTTELWVYPIAYPDGVYSYADTIYSAYWDGEGYAGFRLRMSTTGVITVQSFNGWATAAPGQSSSGISLNTWTHIAVVDDGTNVTLYINGVAQPNPGTSGTSRTAATTNERVWVGGDHLSNIQTSYFRGNIDEVTVWKNYVRYTGNFTPPTEAYPDANDRSDLSPGSGTTGCLPWADILRVGSNLYVLPSQHSVEDLTTSLVYEAA